MRKRIGFTLSLFLAGLFSFSAPLPANAQERGCVYRVSVYVKTAEVHFGADFRGTFGKTLDHHAALNKGAWFEGCTLDEVKAEISQSRYARPVRHVGADNWLFSLSNGIVEIGFTYDAVRKKGGCFYQAWTKDIIAGAKARECPAVSSIEKREQLIRSISSFGSPG